MRRPFPREQLAVAVGVAPTAALCAAWLLLAWREQGSIARGDWLAYATLAAGMLATVLVASDVTRATSVLLAAVVALVGLSIWIALSLAWSPVPALARDEALLLLLYSNVLVLPALTLKSNIERRAAVGLVAATAGLLALGAALHLARAASEDDFVSARLTFPVTYVNANAAVFLAGFWSAVVLSSGRALPVWLRTLAAGAGAAVLAAWLITQSKGAGIALAASAVVVFALAPGRLRLIVPVALPAALVAAAYRPLTAPFRTDGGAALGAAGERAGRAVLVVFAAALALGLAYALVDRRLFLSRRRTELAGRVAAGALAAAVVAGAVLFVVRVDRPADFVADKWDAFKTLETSETGGSHLVNLGSNRYDFWRVELNGFRAHPLAGIGGRGFAVEYRRERRSVEIPARGHSVFLDALLETGIVGFALLVAAFGTILVALARRADTVAGLAALGTFAYFSVHAAGDWIWTIPAAGVPVFVLAGIALSQGRTVAMRRPAALAAAGACVLVALAATAPLLAVRVTDRALERGDRPALDTARRLDPLAVEPWLAELTLARTPTERIAALDGALERDASSPTLHVLLAETLLETGRREEAIAELEEAQRLDPRDEATAAALARARRGRR